MEAKPLVPDNQPWPSDTKVGSESAAEKPRRKSRNRRRKRSTRLSEAAPRRAEQVQEVEVPFTIWDRTNPNELVDPNAAEKVKEPEELPVEQPMEIPVAPQHEKEHKPQKEEKQPVMPESPRLELAEQEERPQERSLEAERTQIKGPVEKAAEHREPAPEKAAEQSHNEEEESEALRQARLQVGSQFEMTAQAAELVDTAPDAKVEEPEMPTLPPIEKQSAKPVEAEAAAKPAEKQADMAREDLLAIGNSIMFEEVSLAEMFRAKRIDEAGLRRVVAAFLRGEDVRKVLANEIVRYQMRFERDPRLRDNLAPRRTNQGVSRRAAKKVAGHAKTALKPQHIKTQASKASSTLLEGFDRAREVAVENPKLAKNVAIAVAVLAYFIILIAIIRA